MYIQQIYTNCLAQASYYIESDGDVAIIDPMRDVSQYLDLAKERSSRIRWIFLTHFHADFVSGHLELARKTKAQIVLGPRANPLYKAIIAEDHEMFSLGACKVEVLHTPGHTIESSCFLLYDEDRKPHSVFTGDTLFVGDVGRPDLLSGNLDAEDLADLLYDSIQKKIKTLPNHLNVYPGHGPGSACGKNLGKETISTIAEQKKRNYAFQLSKEDFIEAVTTDQPIAPAYFFKDAKINVEGYEDLNVVLFKSLKPLPSYKFRSEMNNQVTVLDTRSGSEFANFHIKNSINIGLDGQFAVWAGTLIDFDRPLLLVSEPGKEEETIIRLARIGFEKVEGYLSGGIQSWHFDELTDSIESLSAAEWLFRRKDIQLLDVRRNAEFEKERMSDAVHIPLEQFPTRIKELDKNKSYAIYCAGGYRSMIAASMLKRAGFKKVVNITGGIAAVKKVYPELVAVF